ncbi:MAG: hypothetical protein KBD50_00790 [Candidatus Pacebacteria bacterium]|nr:hypothetical protein [Candidatus Paceibacterota bacterium]
MAVVGVAMVVVTIFALSRVIPPSRTTGDFKAPISTGEEKKVATVDNTDAIVAGVSAAIMSANESLVTAIAGIKEFLESRFEEPAVPAEPEIPAEPEVPVLVEPEVPAEPEEGHITVVDIERICSEPWLDHLRFVSDDGTLDYLAEKPDWLLQTILDLCGDMPVLFPELETPATPAFPTTPEVIVVVPEYPASTWGEELTPEESDELGRLIERAN